MKIYMQILSYLGARIVHQESDCFIEKEAHVIHVVHFGKAHFEEIG